MKKRSSRLPAAVWLLLALPVLVSVQPAGAESEASSHQVQSSALSPADLFPAGHIIAYTVFGVLFTGLCFALARSRAQRREQARELAALGDSHRRLEGEQEDSRRRFQQILDNAGDAIFFIDPASGSLQLVNRQAEEMFGYNCDEIRNLPVETLFPGQQRRYRRLVRRVMRDGYGEEPNLPFRSRDGGDRIGAVHARLGQLGSTEVVHGVVRDVTRVRHDERELRRRNRELTLLNAIAHRVSGSLQLNELLQDILGEVIQVFEADGGGIFLLREDGQELQLAAHRGVKEEVLPDLLRVPAGLGLAGRVAASGQPLGSRDLQKDERLRSVLVRRAGWRGFQAVPLVAKETTVGVLFLFTGNRRLLEEKELDLLLAIGRQVGAAIESARLFEDLQWQNRLTRASNRELERSRQQLRENLARAQQTNQELERLDRMKSNFLSLASHELRTPLTCVVSGIQYLHQAFSERLDADERQLFDAVLEGGRRLDTIIRDMLEAARLESNALYLAREQVDLPVLLEEIRTEFSAILQDRNLNMVLSDLPAQLALTGDAYHLKRTFSRLIENAIKFTPAGHIEVRVALREFTEIFHQKPELNRFSPTFFQSRPRGPLLQVTIRDTGIGIPPEEQVRVFDKFYEIGEITAHSSSKTRFGGKGVGLGLTLVKGMVEAHGGMVWVESSRQNEGEGSAFHVLLPVAANPKEAHG